MTTRYEQQLAAIVLRTDAGEVLGGFRNTREARAHAETLDAATLGKVLVIATRRGVVLGRRWPA